MPTRTPTTTQPLPVDMEAIVPQLADDLEFHPFDEKHYLIQQKKHSHNLKVTALTHQMLTFVDGKRTIAEIASDLQECHSVPVAPTHVYKALYTTSLATCGVVQTNLPVSERQADAYLRIRITLFKQAYVHRLSQLFTFLFEPRRFYVLLAAMLVFLTTLFIRFENIKAAYQAIAPEDMVYLYLVMLFGALLHELGHATACQAFGARPGAIGMGFYLFRPVLYADVSDAWKVPAHKRVVIDLAGIFMEMLFCSLLGMVFLATRQILFLHVSLLIMLSTYTNLNPLLRYDGYWALSDSINVPNLRAHSLARLTAFYQWIRGKRPYPLRTRMDYFLWIYAAISMSFLVLFLFSVLVYNPQSVLYFPYNLVQFFTHIVRHFPDVTFSWIKAELLQFMLPVLFYYLVGNLLYQQWKKRQQKRS